MENTILMTQPKNPDKPSPEPRENYLTYSVNYTNFRADALSGATGKQKTKPRDIPGDPRESSELFKRIARLEKELADLRGGE